MRNEDPLWSVPDCANSVYFCCTRLLLIIGSCACALDIVQPPKSARGKNPAAPKQAAVKAPAKAAAEAAKSAPAPAKAAAPVAKAEAKSDAKDSKVAEPAAKPAAVAAAPTKPKVDRIDTSNRVDPDLTRDVACLQKPVVLHLTATGLIRAKDFFA